MGHKYFPFRELHDLLSHFVKFRRIFYHIVGNAGEVGYEIGDRSLRIYQGMKLIGDLLSIVNKDGDLRDTVLGWLPTRSFNIYNGVQRKFGAFQGKYN